MRKHIKSILSMLIAVCVIGTSIPMTAFAEESQTGKGVTFSTVSENDSGTNSEEIIKTDIISDFFTGSVSEDMESAGTVEMDPVEMEEEDAIDVLTEDTANEADSMTAEDGVAETEDVITRVEWLHELTTLFDMTIEEENYPDNYYSDIDTTSEYYHDIMLATQFGLIDVPAGDPIYPEEPATREFVAHTLNFCLGYVWDEANGYTFAEADDVTYPEDIQVVINNGWMELIDGAFLPEVPITAAEKEHMLADAKEIKDSTIIDEDFENRFEFADGVIVLPEGINIALTNEMEYTIYGGGVELEAGDLFGVVSDNFPIVRKVVSLEEVDGNIVIQAESVSMEESFKILEVQGTMEADLAHAQVADENVEIYYLVGGTKEAEWEDAEKYSDLEEVGEQEISAIEVVKSYDIPDAVRAKYELDEGVEAKISCKLNDVDADYDSTWNSAYLNVHGWAIFDCNVSVDVLESMGIAPSIELVKVRVGLIGYMSAKLEMSFQGDISLTWKEYFNVGVQYHSDTGFRKVTHFYTETFTVDAHMEASVGIRAEAGVDCGFIKGCVYARIGVTASIDSEIYTDGELPANCTQLRAYLYASVGYTVSVHLLLDHNSWGRDFDIYRSSNSPMKLYKHYEDGSAVEYCTREKEETDTSKKRWKYFTPINSKYGYIGVNTGTASNGEPFTVFEYDLDEDGNATITKYNGNVSALNIPETLDGHTVVGIGNGVFSNNSMLRIIVIPDSVIVIDKWAFSNCSNLISVTLSDSLVTLGGYAFYNCDSLTSIDIPKSLEETTWKEGFYDRFGPFAGCDNLKQVTFEDGITEIATYLFANCTGLETIILPNTITLLETGAFNNCSNLSQITFSDNIVEIASYCFANCTQLKVVNLPSKLETLGVGAFESCSALEEVSIPKTLKSTGMAYVGGYSILVGSYVTGVGTLNNKGPFAYCGALKTVVFEEGITSIPGYLFAHCTGLEKVDIPYSVTSIGVQAFDKCSNLQEVVFHEGLRTIGECAFGNCESLTSLTLPDSVTYMNNWCFAKCSKLEKVKLPNKLETLGGGAFCYCSSLNTVEIPKTLKTVNEIYMGGYNQGTSLKNGGPFLYCTNLENVIFEEGTTTIPFCLFAYCTGLKKIEIPASVITIGTQAFDMCINLKEVVLNEGLETTNNDVFAGCSSLEEISIPDTVTGMGTYNFVGCTSLKKAKLPNTRVNLMEGTFKNCTSLTTVEIPETVQNIRRYAFAYCNLEEVSLSDNVILIEEYAFRDNVSLSQLILGNNIETIGKGAFYNCDLLDNVIIPNSVSDLGTYVFANCEILNNVQIGTGVTAIPAYAFDSCASLQKIILPYRVTSIANNSFTNSPKLVEITLPRGLESMGLNSFSYPTQMTFYGITGTYAEACANELGATFVNQEVKATGLELSSTEITMNKGATTNLIMTITPSDFTDEVSWRVSDTSIITVTDTGLITAKAVGNATIRVTVGDLSANCKVTVKQPVTGISLSSTKLTMEALDTANLKATVSPNNAEDKSVVWSSSDEKVATVDQEGNVVAKAKGTASITVTAQDGSGVSKSCTVTVTNNGYVCTEPAQMESTHNYENNCTDVWFYTKEGATALDVTFDVQTEIEEEFDWLYVFDGEGNQIGKYTGTQLAGSTIKVPGDTVKIQLQSDSAGNTWGFKVTNITASNSMEIVEAVEVKLDKTSVALAEGGSYTITATVLPENTSNKAVTWSTSDATVATVKNGTITGVKVGVATITATSANGKTATCQVTVKGKDEVVLGDVPETSWQYVPAQYVYERGLMTGKGFDENGNIRFAPDENLTREQFAQILYSAENKPEIVYSNRFEDVPDGQWYTSAVLWAAEKGIVSGYANGKFGTGDNITREQLAAMLYKYAEYKQYDTSARASFDKFNDTDKISSWATNQLSWAVANGVMNGKGEGLDPIGNATRAECATMLKAFMTKFEQ